MTDDAGDQPPTAAAGNDETTIVPPPTEAAPELAWSSEDYTEAVDRRSAWHWGVVVVAVVLPLAAIAVGAIILFGHKHAPVATAPTPPPVPSTRGAPAPPAPAPPAIAPLNGTYRIVLDYPHQTAGDVSNWHSDKPALTMYWRFTTTCDNGCTARGVRLNPDTGDPMPDVPGRQPNTVTLAYVDDAWRQPTPATNGSVSCPDGSGARAQLSAMWQLTPEPDGALRGTNTVSLPIGACGDNNGWTQTPMYAERAPDRDAVARPR
jgi:serine/threonine-protein kinase